MKNKLAAQLIAAALAMGTVFSGSVVYAAPTATTPYRTLTNMWTRRTKPRRKSRLPWLTT